MNDKRQQELMWVWIFGGTAGNKFAVDSGMGIFRAGVWEEGTGSQYLVEYTGDSLWNGSGVKMEPNNWKKMEVLRAQ